MWLEDSCWQGGKEAGEGESDCKRRKEAGEGE